MRFQRTNLPKVENTRQRTRGSPRRAKDRRKMKKKEENMRSVKKKKNIYIYAYI